MISFLEGTIEYMGDKYLILNTGAIGYKVIVAPRVMNSLSKSKGPVKLHIHSQLNVRDGTFDMYGFDKREDLELFHLLTTVSGIGPKNALGILSSVEPRLLKAAIVNEDAEYLKKTSNLGPKTAQRLILELKNKVDYLDLGGADGVNLTQEGEAMEALVSLGYTMSQAKEALRGTNPPVGGASLQERVKEALKSLGKK